MAKRSIDPLVRDRVRVRLLEESDLPAHPRLAQP
jgi:hypothetical protein